MQLEKQQQLRKYYKKKISNSNQQQQQQQTQLKRSNSPQNQEEEQQKNLCQSLQLLDKLRNEDNTTITQQLSKQIIEKSINISDLVQTQKNMSMEFLIQENIKLKEALKELKELNAQLIAQLVQVNTQMDD